jgi:hypothetical protein
VPSVTYPSGTHVVFTAPGSATNGQYGLFEWNLTSSPASRPRDSSYYADWSSS